MAQENGEKHPQAVTEPARKQSGDGSDKRSSSPVPSPGSDDNGRRGRSRTRTHATQRSEDMYKRR